eukprot:TRINITY_DN12205_c0_g1_i2.p1 TRINITY_DN12205_c0_g1~~TRINITY_DN12205_c0_g1_i2.p1  ORF type:complete len:734 (+),score=140.43 TRINITY_DN12205_c0_g1_i2:63-2264(+)
MEGSSSEDDKSATPSRPLTSERDGKGSPHAPYIITHADADLSHTALNSDVNSTTLDGNADGIANGNVDTNADPNADPNADAEIDRSKSGPISPIEKPKRKRRRKSDLVSPTLSPLPSTNTHHQHHHNYQQHPQSHLQPHHSNAEAKIETETPSPSPFSAHSNAKQKITPSKRTKNTRGSIIPTANSPPGSLSILTPIPLPMPMPSPLTLSPTMPVMQTMPVMPIMPIISENSTTSVMPVMPIMPFTPLMPLMPLIATVQPSVGREISLSIAPQTLSSAVVAPHAFSVLSQAAMMEDEPCISYMPDDEILTQIQRGGIFTCPPLVCPPVVPMQLTEHDIAGVERQIGCIYSDYSPDSGTSTEDENESLPMFIKAETPDNLSVEPCVIEGYKIGVPVTLINDVNPYDIFNMEVWKSLISDKEKLFLKRFLPEGIDPEVCLELLFSGQKMRFESPVSKFFDDLRAGKYHRKIAKLRKRIRHMQRNLHIEKLRDFHNHNVQVSVEYTRQLVESAARKKTDDVKQPVNRPKIVYNRKKIPPITEKPVVAKNSESTPLPLTVQAQPEPVKSGSLPKKAAEKKNPFSITSLLNNLSDDDGSAEGNRYFRTPSQILEEMNAPRNMPSVLSLREARLFHFLREELSKSPLRTDAVEALLLERYLGVFMKIQESLGVKEFVLLMKSYLTSDPDLRLFPLIQVHKDVWSVKPAPTSLVKLSHFWDRFVDDIVIPNMREPQLSKR